MMLSRNHLVTGVLLLIVTGTLAHAQPSTDREYRRAMDAAKRQRDLDNSRHDQGAAQRRRNRTYGPTYTGERAPILNEREAMRQGPMAVDPSERACHRVINYLRNTPGTPYVVLTNALDLVPSHLGAKRWGALSRQARLQYYISRCSLPAAAVAALRGVLDGGGARVSTSPSRPSTTPTRSVPPTTNAKPARPSVTSSSTAQSTTRSPRARLEAIDPRNLGADAWHAFTKRAGDDRALRDVVERNRPPSQIAPLRYDQLPSRWKAERHRTDVTNHPLSIQPTSGYTVTRIDMQGDMVFETRTKTNQIVFFRRVVFDHNRRQVTKIRQTFTTKGASAVIIFEYADGKLVSVR